MSSAAASRSDRPALRTFANEILMFEALADEVLQRLAQNISAAGRASLVVPGGTTPGGFFDLLSTREASWENIVVTLSDERWTDPSSDRSNEKLVRSRLLVNRAAAAHLVPLKTGRAHARESELEVHAALVQMPRPFDVVLLGMGTDCHIASLIPGSQGLARALDIGDPMLARAILPPDPTNMGERMTLTARALLDAKGIMILIKGQAKLEAYEGALAGTDILKAPVRTVLHQTTTPVSVYWAP
jgi:6-phosphogluconolactonase